MQYSRCKCGKVERWCSGYPIKDTDGCTDCGTTLATHPYEHRELVPTVEHTKAMLMKTWRA